MRRKNPARVSGRQKRAVARYAGSLLGRTTVPTAEAVGYSLPPATRAAGVVERCRPGGWPGGVLAARRTQARDACGPAGVDASVPGASMTRCRSIACAL